MKILILGAGPAGLSFANRIFQRGYNDFLVLEKENAVGGLCRSTMVDGSPFDIGGGHFLDVRHPKVNEFLFSFMPKDEWNLFNRDSRIFLKENYISHPIEANIWQFPIDEQIDYLKSIAMAGCNKGENQPEKFVDWIRWKLGEKIAEDYMLPYNRKMFGNALNDLGTYWLNKLPNVSFEDTLRSCLTKKAFGKQPGHAKFYYPKKYGYGELWKRMGEKLGKRIVLDRDVTQIDVEKKSVCCKDGSQYKADLIISSIPWRSFELKNAPNFIEDSIGELKHTSIVAEYFAENISLPAHWIYYPNENVSYHRILLRHNFCLGSRGYWTETNLTRVKRKLHRIHFINEYAYPLNTLDKPIIMTDLLKWGRSNNIYGLGRWGEHQHYNSDVTVGRALELADELCP